MTKLSERMLRDLHVGIGDIVLSDIINEASALEARVEALERGDMVMRLLLQRLLCDCEPRALDDVTLTTVSSTHDFGCAYRREMQPVLAALRSEEEKP